MSVAICLIALSLGYLVFYQASLAKEGLKILGQTIGVIVMIIAALTTACCVTQAACEKWSSSSMMGGCPVSASASK